MHSLHGVRARAKNALGPLCVAGIGLLLSVLWAIWLGHPDFPLDDAYIVQHAVDGLFAGGETRFAGSAPLQGVTSPAHVLLVSLFRMLFPTAWSQLIAAALASMIYAIGVFRFAKTGGVSSAWAGILTVIALSAGLSLYQLLNGLETGLAMGAIIWAVFWFRSPVPERPAYNSILGALPFIRPELGAVSLLLFIREIWSLRRAPAGFSQLPRVIVWAATGAAPFVLFLLLNGASLIPNSMSAKVYFFAEGCLPVVAKIHTAGTAVEQFLLSLGLAGLGFLALLLSPWRLCGITFLLAFVAAYTERFPGALFHNWYRYPYVLIPFAVVGWTGFITCGQRHLRLAGKTLLVLTMALGVLQTIDTWRKYEEGISISRNELAGVSRWITSNLKESDVVLVHDSGYVSLSGKQPLVDLVGLKTPTSIAIHRQYTWASCSRSPLAIDMIARNSGARHFVVLTDWDQIFRLTDSLRLTGWTVTRSDRSRGRTRYEVYEITPPPSRGVAREAGYGVR